MNSLYDTDYHRWAEQQKELLRTGQFERLDIENLLEELGEIMANNRRSLSSQLKRLVTHLLKYHHQTTVINPSRHEPVLFVSWTDTVNNARDEISDILTATPSLRPAVAELLEEVYPKSKANAIWEMNRYLPENQWLTDASFPEDCPWPQEQLLDEDWLP